MAISNSSPARSNWLFLALAPKASRRFLSAVSCACSLSGIVWRSGLGSTFPGLASSRSEPIFPAATLDFPLKNPDAKGAGLARRPIDDHEWSAHARRVADRLSLQGECSQKRVAAVLGVSDRTLVRKLGKCGASYQQLLEGARFSASRTLLRETNLALAEIAAALG